MQKKFYRLGEKIFDINISGFDIKRYSIIVHSSSALVEEPPLMPVWVKKAAEVL